MIYLDEPALGIVPVVGSPLPATPVSPAPDGSRLLTLMAQREYGPEAETLLYCLLKQVSAREEGSVFSCSHFYSCGKTHGRRISRSRCGEG
jgi:hypothetical protein